MLRKRRGIMVVLLSSMATLLAFGGQPFGDQSTSVRDAGLPAGAIVGPTDSQRMPRHSVTPQVLPPALWDNGDTDGSDGYSHAPLTAFGYRRALLDDFVVPPGGWTLTGFSWLMIWNSGGSGEGTGAEILFRADSAGSPGAIIATGNVTGWSEVATGRNWFGRPEERATATFDAVPLGPGTYWVEYLPIGPENSFGMVRSGITGSQCWINYDDYGGLQPGSYVFAKQADLSWQLLGMAGPTYDVSFMDDKGRSQFCVNTTTGAYQWSILSGPGAFSVFTGQLQVLNGGTLFVSLTTDPNALYLVYDVYRHKANGYFYGSLLARPENAYAPAPPVYSPLTDKNTRNDPPCREGGPPV